MNREQAMQVAAQLAGGVLASGKFDYKGTPSDIADFAGSLFWATTDTLLKVAQQRGDAEHDKV